MPSEKSARARSRLAWRRSPWIAGRLDALLAQVLHQAVRPALGAHEEERLVLGPADGGHHLDLVHLVHLEEPVLHGRDRLGRRRHLVEDGLVQVALDEHVHRAVERGREQERLVGLVQPSQHPFHLRHETHVRHAVGFVEHQGLEPLHGHLSAVPEVDEAAGSGDDDIDTLAQLGHLAVEVRSSVDGHCVQAELAGQGRQHPVDLDGELTGRQEHERERPRRPAGRAVALRLARSP